MATPFTINIDEAALQDLEQRLDRARLPDQLQDAGWSYGTELKTLQELVDYWRVSYDWRAQEAYLNSFKHYIAKVNDIDLHFIHEPSSDPEAVPLVLLHGWPGSFFEFHKVIRLLQDPKHNQGLSFHIVAPSLPGYGFSSRPTSSGFDLVEVAKTINELMLLLGYERYVAQGGDWGAMTSKLLGVLHSSNCKALHVNLCVGTAPRVSRPWHMLQLANLLLAKFTGLDLPVFVSAADIENFKRQSSFWAEGSGYYRLQGTKPQTPAYALNDSPTGLLAWILEKFHAWSDCNGDVLSSFTKDELITNVCLYWFTQTISSSMRLYYENQHSKRFQQLHTSSYASVPTGVALLPKELIKPPRAWAEASFNVKQWSTLEKGGHFAALEVPELLAADICKFVAQHPRAAL